MAIRFRNLLYLALYSAFLYWLSDQSHTFTLSAVRFQDKLLHIAAYAVMGWLSWRFFSDYFHRRAHLISVAYGYCIFFALSDEWHQSFVPGRQADVLDWVADIIGAGCIIGWFASRPNLQCR